MLGKKGRKNTGDNQRSLPPSKRLEPAGVGGTRESGETAEWTLSPMATNVKQESEPLSLILWKDDSSSSGVWG